jgi:hypothetical protein
MNVKDICMSYAPVVSWDDETQAEYKEQLKVINEITL